MIDAKKCEELLRVRRFVQQEGIVELRSCIQVQELAGVIRFRRDRVAVEQMAVDLVADFQGKGGEILRHFFSAGGCAGRLFDCETQKLVVLVECETCSLRTAMCFDI